MVSKSIKYVLSKYQQASNAAEGTPWLKRQGVLFVVEFFLEHP